MAETIGSLQIEINSSAGGAVDGITKLRDTLATLKTAVKGGAGLSAVSNNMRKLDAALGGIAGKLTALNSFIGSLRELSTVGNSKISSSIARQITAISTAAGSLSGTHVANLSGLASALYGLSTVPKGNIGSLMSSLSKAPAALAGINAVDLTQAEMDLKRMVAAMEPLEKMGKASGFTSTVKALEKIPKIVATLDDNLLERFGKALESVANSMERVSNASGGMNIAFAKLGGATKHANGLARSMSNVDRRTRNWNIIGIMQRASQFLTKTISLSNEYVEDMNLFTVAMGEYADSAYEYAEKVSAIMGIDPAAWMRNQAIFMTLADGFGVTSERAEIMSRNLTQLGYDLSSFFNISTEDSMQKLQSGISGELEPLRRLGYDLSDARLQAIAYSLGIDRATASMTQAEKAQLRYYAIMTQVTSAQGDMARTLSAPSNQLRIFQAQLTMVGRAIGNIFIPALNAILPIAIAVMQAIRGVATAIASLFGYSLPEVSYTAGLDSVTDSANDTAAGLGNAAGAAKKLKNYLMGFDELNVIPDQSGGGGGGGAGGSAGGTLSGFDFELPEYDFLADAVESNVDRIYKAIEPVVTWIKDNLDTIGILAAAVGGAFASWQVASTFMPGLSAGFDTLEKIQAVAAGLAVLGITVGLTYSFDTTYLKTGNSAALVADGLTTLLGSAIIGRVATKAFGKGAGTYAAAATLAISAGTSIVATYEDAYLDSSWSAETTWTTIMTALKGALAGGVVGFQVGGVKGAAIGAAIGLVATAVVSVVATLVGISEGNIRDKVEWGAVSLKAEEISEYAANMFTVDVVPIISVANAQVEDLSSARAEVQETLVRFEASIKPITLGVDTSPEAISALANQASSLVASLTNLIAEQQETVKVAMSIVPAVGGDGMDMSGDILKSVGLSSATLTSAITAMGEELGELLGNGMTSKFSQEEELRVIELLESLNRISQAVATGEVTGAFTAKTKYMLGDLDKDSALGVISEYFALEQDLEESLRAVQMEAYEAMSGQHAGLVEYLATMGDTLNPEEYANVQAQIDALAAQIAKWNLEDAVAEALQTATTPAREEIQTWWQGLFSVGELPMLTPVGSETDLISEISNLKLDKMLGADADRIAKILDATMRDAMTAVLGTENYEIAMNIADSLGFTGFDLLTEDLQSGIHTALIEAVGEDMASDVFESLGYSIPGAISQGLKNAGGVDAPVIETPDITPITTNIDDAVNSAETNATDKFSNIETEASNTLSFVQTIETDALPALQNLVNDSESAYAGVTEAWADTGTWFQNNVSEPISSAFSNGDWKGAGAKAANGIKSGLKSVKMPSIRINWDVASKAFDYMGQNTLIKIPVPKISFYAGGGFPASGELFVANENGASELVGRIGNRSAVANQDQIGDAIFQYMDAHSDENGMDEERLAAAMVSAMRSAGIGSVYIDGRRITQAINRETQRAGKPALNY